MRIRIRGNSEIYKKKFGSLGAQGKRVRVGVNVSNLNRFKLVSENLKSETIVI